MKVSKDKLKQRVLENIKATKRKRQLQAAIEEILANPDQEILDEKSKRGRAQRKKANFSDSEFTVRGQENLGPLGKKITNSH